MILVFDTETTGLPRNYKAPISDSANWPRAVQVGWQLLDDQGQCMAAQSLVVYPDGFDIPFNAAKVHRITTERARTEGQPLETVLDIFEADLQKATVVAGHNIEFDLLIIRAEWHRLGRSDRFEGLHVLDTKEVSTAFCALPGGRGGQYKWPSLTELYWKLFGTGFQEAHDAGADVAATVDCLLALVQRQVIHANHLGLDASAYEEFRKSLQQKGTAPTSAINGAGQAATPVSPSTTGSAKALPNEAVAKGGVGSESSVTRFVHLHCHSQFSLGIPGCSTVYDLVDHAVAQGSGAIALTDHSTLYGAFLFFQYAHSKGIKPILGLDLQVCKDHRDHSRKDNGTPQLLLARNQRGYQNLVKLGSLSYTEGYYYVPRVSRELVFAHSEGLVATSGSLDAEIPWTLLNHGEAQAEEALRAWKEAFGEHFYLEVQDHGLEEEQFVRAQYEKWSVQYNIPIIVTNNTYYNRAQDADLHDTYLCVVPLEYKDTPIGQGRGYRFGMRGEGYHLWEPAEAATRMGQHPEWLANTLALADSMESYTLQRDVLLPRFEIPPGFGDENQYLRHLTLEGAVKRYGSLSPELLERIDFELQTIAHTGYPGYFLIVQDFTSAARSMGVTVGPGRGSAAGSVVAYCTGITDVDPIRYDLLFERFLNPDRVSMPDIDIDFDDRGREKVMRYVMEKYGRNQVAQIATYHSMAAKSAIRSIGRVMGLQPLETDTLAKLFPEDLNRADYFKKAPLRKLLLNPEQGLKHLDQLSSDDQRKARLMVDMLRKGGREARVLEQSALLEGSFKNSGTHACGVVITPGDLTDYVPVKNTPDAQIALVTQFDNEVAEAAGLLKMDFLGLNTLTIINDAVELVRDVQPDFPAPEDFPLEDALTYTLFQKGETVGIFQYESPGMQKYLKELKPDKFEDLIAMNALYRPGPLAYIPNFINRKHGKEAIVYDLEDMKELLGETYGITVYQEQVMLLSQKLAGFSKGKADELRKAMGKKIPEKLAKLKPQFLEGCKERGHDEGVASKIWKDWEAFAEYAFNKSHSTCYAVVAFRTAYLKAHYPAQFMAAVLSNHMSDITKVAFFLEECRRMGLQVLGPDINESSFRFSVNAAGQIRFGLGAVKGVGEGAVESMVGQRKEGGNYDSLFDFCKRIDLRQANKKTLEALALAGALDRLSGVNGNRRLMLDAEAGGGSNLLEKAMRFGQQFRELTMQSQTSLFGAAGMVDINEPEIRQVEPWPSLEVLRREKEVVGLYITAHPLDSYALEIKHLGLSPLLHLEERPEQDLQMAVMVTDVQYFRDSKNQEVLAFAVEDKDSTRKFRLRGDQAMKFKHLVEAGTALLISGRWEYFQGKDGQQAGFFRFANLELLSELRDKRFKSLTIRLHLDQLAPDFNQRLSETLLAHPGKLGVKVELWVPEDQRSVGLRSERLKVAPDPGLFEVLDVLEVGYSLA